MRPTGHDCVMERPTKHARSNSHECRLSIVRRRTADMLCCLTCHLKLFLDDTSNIHMQLAATSVKLDLRYPELPHFGGKLGTLRPFEVTPGSPGSRSRRPAT